MPVDYSTTDHFKIISAEEDQVFMLVSDHRYDDEVGNLFISDGQGKAFTHSMEGLIMSNRGRTYDFERIEAMFGTYIANRYDKDHGTMTDLNGGKLKQTLMEEEIEAEYVKAGDRTKGMMNAKQMATRQDEKKNVGTSRQSTIGFRDNIKTYISHNKGAFWELVRAPETDMKGKPTKCYLEDGCSLHFNIYNRLGDAYHAPPYSSENAVGVIMAVGNTGKVLKKNRGDKKNTYLSRDGGL